MNVTKTVHYISNRICFTFGIQNNMHLRRIVRMYLEERLMVLSSVCSHEHVEYLVFHDVASYIHNQEPPMDISFKTLVHCILCFQKLYTYTLEKRYAPGGKGYTEAYENFKNICQD